MTPSALPHSAGAMDGGKQTPVPWRVEKNSLWIIADGVPKGPMHVADVRGWGYLTGKGSGALGLPTAQAFEIQRANAALIVRAVNSHEALVAALGEFVILGPGKCSIGKAAIDKAVAPLSPQRSPDMRPVIEAILYAAFLSVLSVSSGLGLGFWWAR